MEPDYPAAHSMDTTWFAVDRDGNIGVFNSGDAGVVPEGWPDRHLDPATDDAQLLLAQQVEEYLATLSTAGWEYGPIHGHTRLAPYFRHWPVTYRWDPLNDLLMFLAAREPVAGELAAGKGREVPTAEGIAIAWNELPIARFEQLHADGYCLHCRFSWYGYEAEPSDPARGALFHFEHLNDGGGGNPYALESQPRRPLRIDQLPSALRAEVARVGFPELSFTETSFFNPLEHVPCRTWGELWGETAAGGERDGPPDAKEQPNARERG